CFSATAGTRPASAARPPPTSARASRRTLSSRSSNKPCATRCPPPAQVSTRRRSLSAGTKLFSTPAPTARRSSSHPPSAPTPNASQGTSAPRSLTRSRPVLDRSRRLRRVRRSTLLPNRSRKLWPLSVEHAPQILHDPRHVPVRGRGGSADVGREVTVGQAEQR